MARISTGIKHPRNSSPNSQGSIHDDDVATKLGFRGGAIAGSIHFDQFGPALLETFGPQWFETGSLGLFFLHPLTDQEPVEGFIEIGDETLPLSDARTDIIMTMPDETVVATGTASVGRPTESSPISTRDRRPVDPSTLRILSGATIGLKLPEILVSPSKGDQRERVTSGLMTSPLDWYISESPWGGPVCSPLTISRLMTGDVMNPLAKLTGPVVPLYGALELRIHDGPLFLDDDYLVSATLTDVAETPKTEIFWCEVEARRATSPSTTPVATFTMMARIVKASSPLYND
jgi:hypothetical protein